MVACAFAVLQTGAKPVFVDADPETWTLDWRQIESKITSRTKVIMAVHIYGHPADMDPVRDIACKHKLLVLEDAAEAHGALYKGKRCGSLSDIAVFSFYANKIITTGEGGMVLTNDDRLHGECLRFKNLCFPIDGNRNYIHDDVGYNYRMTNVQAAIGVAQLDRIDSLVAARRRTAARYLTRLTGSARLSLPVEKPWAQNVYWMFGVMLKKSVRKSREEITSEMRAAGIDTRPFFQPMSQQPALRKAGAGDDSAYPVTESLAARGFYLPSSGDLSEENVDRVCQALERALD
jgi:perosamine synthetase